MTHSELIDALGGTVAVATHLGVSPSTVSNWRERGVPWHWRATVARWAAMSGIHVPDAFTIKETVNG